VQASLDQQQRLQQLFFPEGIAYDGNRFNRTAVTAPLFKYLAPSDSADEKMVSQEGIEPSTRRLRVQSVLENRRNPNDFAGQVCRMRQRAATGRNPDATGNRSAPQVAAEHLAAACVSA